MSNEELSSGQHVIPGPESTEREPHDIPEGWPEGNPFHSASIIMARKIADIIRWIGDHRP